MSDLVVMLVALPLLASVVPVLVGGRSSALARDLTLAILVAQVGLALAVAWLVATAGPIEYVVGGVPAAVGIGLLADRLSVVFVVTVAGGALAVFLADRATRHTGPYYSLWLLIVAGLTGVCITADVFNLYVFLEISGLAAYALVASARGPQAALAALKYLLVGTVGATLYLLGVGYAYVATGTLAMADLVVALEAAGHDSTLVVAAFVLMVVGLGVKAALFPLHAWKPDAYAAAPSAVSALLGALAATVAGYALVRIVYDVFTVAFLRAVPELRLALLALACVSVLAGSALALRERDVRRLLAYSSVSQFGLIAVGIVLASPLALLGALVHLVGHAVMKLGLFLATGELLARYGVRTVEEYAGLASRVPLVSAAVAVLGVSMVGLPPTVGFAAKWYLALGAVETGAWLVAGVVLVSTLLSLAYVGRLVERLYLGGGNRAYPAAVTDGGRATDRVGVAVVVAMAVLVVGLGLGSTALADWFAPLVEGWL